MSTKAELITKMLEMQKKFISHEHSGEFSADNYYMPPAGHPLEGYIKEYNEIAKQVNEMAHAEAGSKP